MIQQKTIKIFEIGTGYTSIPAKVGAATEIVVEELVNSFLKIDGVEPYIIDIKDKNRKENNLPIIEVYMPQFFSSTDTSLGVVHKLKRVLYSISLSYKLWGIIKKSKEEVILHFHNQYNYFFFHKIVPQKIRNRCKTMYTVHSYIWFNVWNEIDEIVKKRYFQEIFSVKNADKIFVLNNTTKNHFVEKLNIEEERIVKIPNGVNTSIYKPLEKDQIDILKKQNGLSGKKIFLQVGSVCERKNQWGALSLLQSLLVENKNCVFAYAGGIIDQEYQNKIKEFSKENNINEQVVYLGELSPGSKLNEYYNIAESLVFVPESEAFSLVIIEAMSAGIPVIMKKDTGLEIPGQSSCGILMFENKQTFTKIIEEEVLDNTARREHSIAARKVVELNYSWDIIASMYLK